MIEVTWFPHSYGANFYLQPGHNSFVMPAPPEPIMKRVFKSQYETWQKELDANRITDSDFSKNMEGCETVEST